MQGISGPSANDVVVQQTVQQPAVTSRPQVAEEQAEQTHPAPAAEGQKGRYIDEFV